MVKKLWCVLLVLLMLLCFAAACAESLGPTRCDAYLEDSPCDIIWWVNKAEKLHCRACRNHVTDKENILSHVPVTEWTACTLDEGGQCTVCGYDYVMDPDDELSREMAMLEAYMATEEPVEVTHEGKSASIRMTDAYRAFLERLGVTIPEELYLSTEYTLTMPDGDAYASTGEEIRPDVLIARSRSGPGAWMEKYEQLSVSEPAYANNVLPGKATVSVTMAIAGGETFKLTIEFTITGEMYCKYGSADSPCDIIWWLDTEKKQHCRACRNHVEDKEAFDYVRVTEWEDCTIDETSGKCTVCSQSYKPESGNDDDDLDALMLEAYTSLSEEIGSVPVNCRQIGSKLNIEFSPLFFTRLEEWGVTCPESMMVETTFTLKLNGGSIFDYTGSPIDPEPELIQSEYGPAAWLLKHDKLTIGEITCADNMKPGKGSAKVDITVDILPTYTLAADFTILDGSSDCIPGDASDDGKVTIDDVLAVLRYVGRSGDIGALNLRSAEVTGDGNVDAEDVLLLMQYLAGWDVVLK